jgi:hypothetical protein
MKKIVINACYGGFSLSDKAMLRYCELKGITVYPEKEKDSWGFFTSYFLDAPDNRKKDDYNVLTDSAINRDDPALVQVVEELREEAGGHYSKLKIVEIPDDVFWHIAEYDGYESVAENHRSWG